MLLVMEQTNHESSTILRIWMLSKILKLRLFEEILSKITKSSILISVEWDTFVCSIIKELVVLYITILYTRVIKNNETKQKSKYGTKLS